jgi:hypothetical protein
MPPRTHARRIDRASTILASCALIVASACRHTAGSIDGDRYVAHDNAFSLPVPKLSVGLAVQQGLDKDTFGNVIAGYVTFHDDFGNMRSIEYEAMTATYLNALSEEARAKNYFGSRLHDQYVARMMSRFPGTRIVEGKLVTLADGTVAWFGVIKIPVPNETKSGKTPKPPSQPTNVLRGFLFLPHKNLFLTLSLANDPSGALEPTDPEHASASAEFDRIKSELEQLYESMRFG